MLAGVTWSGSSTSLPILPSASLKLKSNSVSLASVTFTLKMFSTLKVSSLKNAATSSCHKFQALMHCNFMALVTTKVLTHAGSLGAHFSVIVSFDIHVIIIPIFRHFTSS